MRRYNVHLLSLSATATRPSARPPTAIAARGTARPVAVAARRRPNLGLSGFSARNPGTRVECARPGKARGARKSVPAIRDETAAEKLERRAVACGPGAKSCGGATETQAAALVRQGGPRRMGPWYARPQSGSRSQGRPARNARAAGRLDAGRATPYRTCAPRDRRLIDRSTSA